jgi:hypothetical protein
MPNKINNNQKNGKQILKIKTIIRVILKNICKNQVNPSKYSKLGQIL